MKNIDSCRFALRRRNYAVRILFVYVRTSRFTHSISLPRRRSEMYAVLTHCRWCASGIDRQPLPGAHPSACWLLRGVIPTAATSPAAAGVLFVAYLSFACPVNLAVAGRYMASVGWKASVVLMANNWNWETASTKCEFRRLDTHQIEEGDLLLHFPLSSLFICAALTDWYDVSEDREAPHHRLCHVNICCLLPTHHSPISSWRRHRWGFVCPISFTSSLCQRSSPSVAAKKRLLRVTLSLLAYLAVTYMTGNMLLRASWKIPRNSFETRR